MATQPAIELLPSNHVVPITRPAYRFFSLSRVIEILAGTANGCLQELGYTPGLIERIKHLEEASVKLRSTNEQLYKHTEKLKLYADELKQKCLQYQSENVKLYEDNSKIINDCNGLREEIINLRAKCVVNEETRGKDVSEILAQYALLKTQYAEAVKALGLCAAQINTMAVSAAVAQPVQLSSGSREIRPTQVVPSQARRVSAPQLQTQPQPHLVNNQSMRPATLRPAAQIVGTSSQRQNSGTAVLLGWNSQHGTPPLPTPTSAGAPPVPPPGYGPYAAGVAGPSSYRPASGASMGHGTPTTTFSPTAFSPTTQMQSPADSAVGVGVGSAGPSSYRPPQWRERGTRFANDVPPDAADERPPAESAEFCIAGDGKRTSARATAPWSLALNLFIIVVQIAPAAPVPVPVPTPPPAAPAAPPPHFVTQNGDMVPQPAPPAPPEMAVDGAPDVDMQVDAPPETLQDDGAPPEPQDPGSPPEAHEALTPPLDSSGALGVTVAADPSPGVNGDGGAVARVKAEEEAPTVKMEVDEDGGDEEEDEDEEEDGNEVDYIELGPDGLRTAKDCVAAVFDPDKNFVCRFCEARHNADLLAGIQSEPPPEMPNATLEERAAHCETEHEHVWGILRRNI
ncbi:hypothetical protein MVEN_01218000 [Mycena venus]|uniref:Uncharacterized protein n=1 Tax=Mycena venus TaxID=2733690 RepID=A0A8H6Y1V7_9AGAR|nr:hypothetical protein MVEN_01218000 [Mycena venus]